MNLFFLDINECKSANPCDDNASCSNNVGSYVCQCNNGFVGDGKTCSDINECSTQSHNCKPGYQCVNTVGGYKCVDIDECSIVNECDLNALHDKE